MTSDLKKTSDPLIRILCYAHIDTELLMTQMDCIIAHSRDGSIQVI